MQAYTEAVVRLVRAGFRVEDAVIDVWYCLMNDTDRERFQDMLAKTNPALASQRTEPVMKFLHTCSKYLSN